MHLLNKQSCVSQGAIASKETQFLNPIVFINQIMETQPAKDEIFDYLELPFVAYRYEDPSFKIRKTPFKVLVFASSVAHAKAIVGHSFDPAYIRIKQLSKKYHNLRVLL